jgi:hypothetical protein
MATTQPIYDHFTNPVDMVEHIATIHAWTFERSAPDELTLTVAGAWCDYHISLTWRDDLEALHLACAFDFKVSKLRLGEIYKLMALINEQLWLGHFDLWKEDGLLLFLRLHSKPASAIISRSNSYCGRASPPRTRSPQPCSRRKDTHDTEPRRPAAPGGSGKDGRGDA